VIVCRSAAELERMREAGRLVGEVLTELTTAVAPGVSTAELDEIARDVLARNGAYSPFLNYQPGFAPVPFPATICTSVNDAALHGIPGRYKLADGDLLSVDCGAVLDGWTGDAAVSFTIGTARRADKRLIDVTRDALRAGIAAAVPGARIGDISAAIGAVGRAGGYGICTDFGGHGVGRTMHEDPSVPNEGARGRGRRLVPGLVIAIEPWFLAGGRDMYRIDRDGWTIRSGDGSRAAHAEHTVAVTEDGPQVLTVL